MCNPESDWVSPNGWVIELQRRGHHITDCVCVREAYECVFVGDHFSSQKSFVLGKVSQWPTALFPGGRLSSRASCVFCLHGHSQRIVRHIFTKRLESLTKDRHQ